MLVQNQPAPSFCLCVRQGSNFPKGMEANASGTLYLGLGVLYFKVFFSTAVDLGVLLLCGLEMSAPQICNSSRCVCIFPPCPTELETSYFCLNNPSNE